MAKRIPPPGKEPLRLVTPTYIMGAHTWSVTTFVSNIKIISTRPVPRATNASPLRPRSSGIRSTSAGNSTRLKLSRTASLPSLGTNSRHSSDKVLENSLRLLTTFGVKSKETLNISRKKYKTGLLTCNTSNPSWWNLTFDALPLKTCYVDTFTKASDH